MFPRSTITVKKTKSTTTFSTTGLFLYVDSMFGETGRAILQSQMFVPEEDNDLCFHFWFYLKVYHVFN